MKILPTICPACSSQLKVKSLVCENCETEIQGKFELSSLASLSPDEQEFIIDFMKASGSLKDLAIIYKLSYPTIRNRLDEIIERIKQAQNRSKKFERKSND